VYTVGSIANAMLSVMNKRVLPLEATQTAMIPVLNANNRLSESHLYKISGAL